MLQIPKFQQYAITWQYSDTNHKKSVWGIIHTEM